MLPGSVLDRSFGKYRIIAELGLGGMAEVHLAVSQGPAGFNKLVVIKQLLPQLANDPDFLTMFLEEARLAARLNHPNVVQTNEVGQIGNTYYQAMEYVDGQSLYQILQRCSDAGRQIPVPILVCIISRALTGLHYAHEVADFNGTPLGIVHRDVTPQNVFVSYDGVVKMIDFGIAKAVNSSVVTSTGVMKGKIAYLAPEQVLGHAVDRRTDLFQAGVVLWEALAGQRLWGQSRDLEILRRLVTGDIPRLDYVRNDLPARLQEICARALAHDVNERYPTAAAIQTDLEAYLEESGTSVTNKDIGDLVSSVFSDRRQQMRDLIETKLASTGAYTHAPSTANDPINGNGGEAAADARHQVPSDGQDAVVALDPSRAPLNASEEDVVLVRRERRFRILARWGVVPIVVGTAMAVVGIRNAPRATKQASETQATTSSTLSRKLIALKIRSIPAEAKLFVDGAEVLKNPFEGTFPRDDRPHVIRAEAAGYVTESQNVDFSQDREFILGLSAEQRSPPAAGSGSAMPPSASHASPTHKPRDTRSRPRRKRLDPSDPWN